jgi:hypothetical protein
MCRDLVVFESLTPVVELGQPLDSKGSTVGCVLCSGVLLDSPVSWALQFGSECLLKTHVLKALLPVCGAMWKWCLQNGTAIGPVHRAMLGRK